MKKSLSLLKEWGTIILILSLCLLLGLFCWLKTEEFKDFGLNFFTEILGVVITVFVIERFIQKKEDKRNLPQKLAAYEDVRLYTSRYISFWTETYRCSVPETEPNTLEKFFSENGMTKILSYLYMDSSPNVIPQMSWWDWMLENAKEFKENGEKILDRYSYNLDPIVFGCIHQLAESPFYSCILMLPSIRKSDTQYNTPRVKVLGSYTITPPQEDYDAILKLVRWCNETYNMLKKYNKSIIKVAEYLPAAENKNFPPKCMIPEGILSQQIREVEEYRK